MLFQKIHQNASTFAFINIERSGQAARLFIDYCL